MTLLNKFIRKGRLIWKGAEADLYLIKFENKRAILKYRSERRYRNKELDNYLRRYRTYTEAVILYELSKLNFPSPILYYVNLYETYLIMEYIEGEKLKDSFKELSTDELKVIGKRIGYMTAFLHNNNIVHNDLTTSNFIITGYRKDNYKIYFIDFGLSIKTSDFREKAVDIDVLRRVLYATHPERADIFFKSFIEGYLEKAYDSEKIMKFYYKLSKMGRYFEKR